MLWPILRHDFNYPGTDRLFCLQNFHCRLQERNKSSNDVDLMDDDFDDEILVPNIARAASVPVTYTKQSHTGKALPPCSSGSSLNTSSQDDKPSPVIQPTLHQVSISHQNFGCQRYPFHYFYSCFIGVSNWHIITVY